MPAPRTVISESLVTDPIDLSDALEVARALWEKGQWEDAIRWVRRAVEAADEAGDASRVAALAREAAELADLVAPVAPSSSIRLASRAMTPFRTAGSPPSSRTPPPRSSTLPAVRPTMPPRSTTPPPLPSTAASRPTLSAPRPIRPEDAPADLTRLRVSVRTSARDGALLEVRPLPEGAAPPPGTREAFLVMTGASEITDVTDFVRDATDVDVARDRKIAR